MSMSLGKEGALKNTREVFSAKTEVSMKDTQGMLALWEIADLERIPYDPNNKACMKLLMEAVADIPSQPHSKKALAGASHRDGCAGLTCGHSRTRPAPLLQLPCVFIILTNKDDLSWEKAS